MKLKPIENQVVVAMGASSGIGRETALRFAKRGAKVVVAARNEAGLRSLEDEIRALGGEARVVVADVSEFEQVEAVAQSAVEEYGQLDTWVHLAAAGLFAPFDQTEPDEFRRVVEVDLMGQVYGAMAALPHIKREGRGALVHISSVVGARRPYRALTAPPSTASRASWSRCVSSSCKRGGTASASPTSCRRPSTRRSSPRPAPSWESSPRGSPRSTSRALWSMRFSTALRRRPGR